MIGRAVISAVDDSKNIQLMKIDLLADETKEGVERFQNYGFTSYPKAGAEGLVLFVGGDRDHGIVVNVDDRRFRLKNLAEGEVALFTDEGDKIHFKRGNVIEIQTQHAKIISNDVEIGSGVLEKILNGESFQTFFNSHTHVGNMGAPTSPPQLPSDPSHLSTKVKGAK